MLRLFLIVRYPCRLSLCELNIWILIDNSSHDQSYGLSACIRNISLGICICRALTGQLATPRLSPCHQLHPLTYNIFHPCNQTFLPVFSPYRPVASPKSERLLHFFKHIPADLQARVTAATAAAPLSPHEFDQGLTSPKQKSRSLSSSPTNVEDDGRKSRLVAL